MPSRVRKLKRSGHKSNKKKCYQNEHEVPIRVIYVTQFEKCPFRVTSTSLKTFFEKAGSVERVVYVGKSTHTFAFITYHNSEDAQKVLADPTFQQIMKIRKADRWHQPKNNEKKGDTKVDHNLSDDFRLLILNNDCLLYLFSFLPPVDAANLAGTDDRIRLVSQMHFKKYSHWEDKCLKGQNIRTINLVYEHIGPWITSLTFDAILSNISTDLMIGIFSKCCSNVETFHVSNVDYRKKSNALVKTFCSKIKRFEMDNCNVDDFTMSELFTGSNLEHLIISDCDYITGKCFSKLTNLKTLKIRSCSKLRDDQIGKGLLANRLLTEFELLRCTVMFGFIDVKYVQNLNSLTFDICNIPNIDKLLELNQLKKLKLICYGHIQMDSFLFKLGQKDMLEQFHIQFLEIGQRAIEAFESFKKLTTLNLISPLNENKDMFFKRLPIVLPQLKSFNYQDSDISMDNIMLTIKKLQQLEYFDISSYGCVTMDEIVEIIEVLKNLNRPLLHLIVADDSFWSNSNWKADPIMLSNKQILKEDVKISSDDSYGYESDESDGFFNPFYDLDDSDDSDDSDERNMIAMAFMHMVSEGLRHNFGNNLDVDRFDDEVD